MIILMGVIHLDPIDVNEFVTDIPAITRSTRSEKGCLFYAVTLDDAPAGRLLMAGRWQDQQALTAHHETPDTLAFLEKWNGRMKSDIEKYDVTNEQSSVD
ncbi:putative quinol monooxygenase [Thalassospira alkalitolerans]|uniref:putative quinol monooxygenase n=1 Tax=Thalassospira alkalitolerans TaxID=1293890 RepID=UPI003AA8FDD6